MFSAPLTSNSKFYLYHISNIHTDVDRAGSLLYRVFNLSVFIPIARFLSYLSFMLIWLGESLLQNFLGCF